jgi:hypothetical protein
MTFKNKCAVRTMELMSQHSIAPNVELPHEKYDGAEIRTTSEIVFVQGDLSNDMRCMNVVICKHCGCLFAEIEEK